MYTSKEEQAHQAAVIKLAAINELLAHMTRPESPETMSTIRQIEANRQNALKSTGPKSTGGKAAVAQNALKHGLYGSTLLLPEEDPAQYEVLCHLHIDQYQPEGLEEIDLVGEIVTGKWELARMNLMKQGVYAKARKWLTRLDKKGEESHPSAVRICMEVGGNDDYSKAMARVSQMEGRIQRHCERARRELSRLQKERADRPQPQPGMEAAPAPEPPPPEEAQAPETTVAATPEAAPTPEAAATAAESIRSAAPQPNGRPLHPPTPGVTPQSGQSGG